MEIKYYINLGYRSSTQTHVSTNLIPVLVCKHFSMIPPPSICSIPSSAPALIVSLLLRIEKTSILINIYGKWKSSFHPRYWGGEEEVIHRFLNNSPEFLFPGNFTGDASAAMAYNEWNVEPIRSQSFVPILGALGPNERCRIRPPDLFTTNRCKNPILKVINVSDNE